MRKYSVVLLLLITALITACAGTEAPPSDALTPVRLMLDWVPNVNHLGIFVAGEEGYFEEAGLAVEIIQPGEVFAEQAVAGGAADIGVSFQEYVTLSRATDIPIVSVAAIIQDNSSGFAALASAGLESPADFEGLRYGSFGSPFEEATLRALMSCAGGDPDSIEIVETGFADPLSLLAEGQIDLAWIFYGTQFFQAEDLGIDLDLVMMNDWFDCIPNYYTPVFIASEGMISDQPQLLSAFLSAVSRGYTFAAENPESAASILLEAVPELDSEQVQSGADWLADRWIGDAPRWGEQDRETWEAYTNWMAEQRMIAAPIDADSAFTNDFLP